MSKRCFFGISKELQFNSQSGQVAVIVFLIMAVLLVVGLSLATRTSQEIELAGQQEDTTRVFNAAESGIEQALSEANNFTRPDATTIPIANLGANDTQTEGKVTIRPESGFANTFQSGETATVFTSGTAGNFNIWWHDQGTNCSDAAVLVITVYIEEPNNSNNYIAEHYGVSPNCAVTNGTNFILSNISGTITRNNKTYQYGYRLPLVSNTKMVRIKPLRNQAAIMIDALNGVLSQQLYNIRSEAQDSSSGNTEVRAIEVTRTRPAPPSIFDYALYSGGNLTK